MGTMKSLSENDLLSKAEKCEKNGKPKLASRCYAELGLKTSSKKQWSVAKDHFKKALKLTPDSPRLYLYLARISFELDELEEAQSAITSFTQKIQSNLQKYEPYVEILFRKYPSLKETYYQQRLSSDSTNGELFFKATLAQIEQEKWQDAFNSCVQAIQSGFTPEKLHGALLQLATRLDPESGRESLELYIREKIDLEEFSRRLSKKENPEIGPAPSSLSDLVHDLEESLGLSSGGIEVPQESFEKELKLSLQKALPKFQQDPKTYLDLANAFYEMGELNQAKLLLKDFNPRTQNYVQSQVLRAQICFAENDWFQALDILQKVKRTAKALSPQEKLETDYGIVLAYFRLGDWENVKTSLEKVKRVDPRYRNILEIETELKRIMGSKKERKKVA